MGDSRPVLAHQARKQHLAQQAAKTTPIQRTVQKIMIPPAPQPRAPIATRPTPKRTIMSTIAVRNTGTPATVSDVSTITGQHIDDLPKRGHAPEATIQTLPDYYQESHKGFREIQTQEMEFHKQKSTIEPTAIYMDPETQKPMPGIAILGKYFSTSHERQFQQAHIQAWGNVKEIEKMPLGTTFKKEAGIVSVIKPDPSLDWTKRTFKKIDIAYKKNPALGFMAELGFGTVSSWGALLKPVLDVTLGDKYKRSQHFVSPFDIAFEPLGWAPKGSTNILKSRPVFSAGGVGTEVIQAYTMTQVLKPIGAGAKIGTKFAVSKTPVIFSKMATTFPKAFSKPLVTKTTTAITKTGFSKNIYGWAAKGMKPGKALVYRSLGEPASRGGLLIQKSKFVVDRSLTNPLGKRIWLTAPEVAKYEARIAASGTFNIGFPTSRTVAGVGDVVGATEGTVWKRGLMGALKKSSYTSTATKKIGTELYTALDDMPIKGSLYNVQGKTSSIIKLSGSRTPELSYLKKLGVKGYSYFEKARFFKTTPGELGNIGVLRHGKQTATGWGSLYQTPLPKKWITKKLSVGFFRSQEATASLLSRSKTVLKYAARTTTTSRSFFLKAPARVAPSVAFTVPTYISARVTTGYLSGGQISPSFKQVQTSQPTQAQRQKFILAQLPAVKVVSTQAQRQTPIKATRFKIKTKQIIKAPQIFKTVTTTKVVSIAPPISAPGKIKTAIPMLPIFPTGGLYGAGRKGYDERKRKKKYKFRKFDIGGII